MTILFAGGAGKTSVAIARILLADGVPFLMTSRQGSVKEGDLKLIPIVRFSYTDPETYSNCFSNDSLGTSTVSLIYIMVPPSTSAEPVTFFVDYARQQAATVKFVLLAGASLKMDSSRPLASVWKHLNSVGVDYAVLTPSWFVDNLLSEEYLAPIQSEEKLYTAMGDGKLPWVATEDIAAVAVKLLTCDEVLGGRDYSIIGSELLDNDAVAGMLSMVLRRHMQHIKVSQEKRMAQMIALGKTEERAKFVAFLEGLHASGIGEVGFPSSTVKDMTGREGVRVDEWIKKHQEECS